MSRATRHEVLVGLHVSDNEAYSRYRVAMTPLLEAVGGSFRYDFTIEKVLKGVTDPPINRLFVIAFPDEATMNTFFADPTYVAAKSRFFEPSVDLVKILAAYESVEE